MSDNQTVYEVIRDIGYAIFGMKHDKILAITVIKDTEAFFSWRTSQGHPGGLSETAHAIELAYKVSRGMPDARDVRISKLEAAIVKYQFTKTTGDQQRLFELLVHRSGGDE